MSATCPNCNHVNEAYARFCSNCGRSLGGACAGKKACGGFPIGLVIACVLVWLALGRGCPISGLVKAWPDWLESDSHRLVQRTFEMPAAKADAMFVLLRPSDVRVIVGRCDGGVLIKGTPTELEVVGDFVGLVTRLDSSDRQCLDAAIRDLRGTWTCRRTYELPHRKATALHDILAFDDVPVLVHGYTSRVIVDATEADQKLLGDVVAILRGQRL